MVPVGGGFAVSGCGGLCGSRLRGICGSQLRGKLGAAGAASRDCVHMCPQVPGTFTRANEDGPWDGPPCCCFIHNLCLLEGRPLALGLAQHREPVARGKCLEELKASGVSAGPPGAHGAQSRVCSTAPTGS